MDQALSNPLILSKILAFSRPCAMDLRQVCKTWNEVMLSMPRPMLHLKLGPYSGISSDTEFVTFCSTLSSTLVSRSLYVPQSFIKDVLDDPHHHDVAITTASANLLHFSQTFTSQLQYLTISLSNRLIPTFYRILRQFSPALKQLNLYLWTPINEEVHDEIAPLPVKPSLTAVSITIGPKESLLPQQIIDCSVNLTTLRIKSKIYLDLSKNSNIRDLSIEWNGSIDDPTAVQCSRMLQDVSTNIQYLTIIIADADFPTLVRIPGNGFPKLDYFRCDSNIFEFPYGLESINNKKSGKLHTLVITHSYEDSASLNFPESLTSVRKLSLRNIFEPEILMDVLAKFPGLEELHISFCIKDLPDAEQDEDESSIFANCLEYFHRGQLEGKLQNLSLSFAVNLKLTPILLAMRVRPHIFKGLQKLSILTETGYHVIDDITSKNKQMWIPNLEGVVGNLSNQVEEVTFGGVMFALDTACHLRDFMQGNNLRVKFHNEDFEDEEDYNSCFWND